MPNRPTTVSIREVGLRDGLRSFAADLHHPDGAAVAGGEQIFLAAVSDAQWLIFCDALGLTPDEIETLYRQRAVA